MIRWIVLALACVGLLVVFVFGRLKKRTHHFFWRRVLVVWVLLAVTVGVAVLPVASSTTVNRVSTRDIIFVVDTTQSMNAVDGRGGNETTRLQNVRDDMHRITKDQAGATIGMFTFSDQAGLYLPLTTGVEDASSAIDTLYTADQYQTVSKVASYTKVFEELGTYLASQYKLDPTRQRVVVMLSDFEIYKNQEQTNQIVEAARVIKENHAGFAGIVYGQDAGAKMLNMTYDYENSEYIPTYKKYGDTDYTKYLQNNYKTVLSTPNPELAIKIASGFGGSTARATDENTIMPTVTKAIKQANAASASNPQSLAMRQNVLYVVPALAAFCWLCITEYIRPKWLDRLAVTRKPTKPKVKKS